MFTCMAFRTIITIRQFQMQMVEQTITCVLFALAFYSAAIIGSPIDEPYEMTIGKERLKYLFSFGAYKDFDFYNSRF